MGLSDTVFSDDEEEEDEETHLNRFLTNNNNNKNLSASRYKHPKDVEQACLRLHVRNHPAYFFNPCKTRSASDQSVVTLDFSKSG